MTESPVEQPEDPILREMEELYALAPETQCVNHCGPRACGPIDMTKWERDRIERLTGIRIPEPSQEWVDLWERGFRGEPGRSLLCPAYNIHAAQCKVYDYRPLICRLWGSGRGENACWLGCATSARPRLQSEEIFEAVIRSFVITGETTEANGDFAIRVFRNPEIRALYRAASTIGPIRRAAMKRRLHDRIPEVARQMAEEEGRPLPPAGWSLGRSDGGGGDAGN